MKPQTERARVIAYLNVYPGTSAQKISVATRIKWSNLCRVKRELENAGIIKATGRCVCPISGQWVQKIELSYNQPRQLSFEW